VKDHKYRATLVITDNHEVVITDEDESANNLLALADWLEECADELRSKGYKRKERNE
jgi:hypothetical protein